MSPLSPLRIAVLECDTPQPNTKERYGGYGGLFEELLRSGASHLASHKPPQQPIPDLTISKYDIVNTTTYPSLDSIDAILLTGSKHNAFDNEPWILRLVDFVRYVLKSQTRVRVIGVCFGHQIVARALNAPVARSDRGWEVAVVDVPLTSAGAQVLGLGETDTLRIHQMHRDVVLACPEGMTVLGATDRCDVQGFYAPKRLLCVQGHPEFSGPIEEEILAARYKQGIFEKEEYEEAISRVRNPHDGVAVAAAFVSFLLDGEEANGVER